MDATTGNPATVMGHSSDERYDVFISYRRKTGIDVALAIMYWFSLKGIKCFIDVMGLEAGEYEKKLFSVIENAKYFLVLLTDDALASEWVANEVKFAREKLRPEQIVPVSIDKDYNENDYENNSVIKGLQGFQLRHADFDGCLKSLVEKGMKEFRGLLAEHEDRVDRLLSSMRWYKRNDGRIDSDEWRQVLASANALGIDSPTVQIVKAQVEEEWIKERQFIKVYIMPRYKRGNRIDLGEHGELQKAADEHGISQDRLNELILAVNAKESGKRKFFWMITTMVCVVCIVALVFLVAWWYGKHAGEDEAKGRDVQVIAEQRAEIEKLKQANEALEKALESEKEQLRKEIDKAPRH